MPSSGAATPAATAKWLSVIGIGEDGVAGLGETARKLIADAEFVFGGTRHLELAASLITGRATPWPTPFDSTMSAVRQLRGHRVCVLASGDPFFFGVGVTLAAVIPAEEMIVAPSPSAFSLAASRLGWPLQEVEIVSQHGRPLELVTPLLHPGRRVLALTSGSAGPRDIGDLLTASGFAASTLTVLERLGGDAERKTTQRADEIGDRAFADLNVVAIDVVADKGAKVIPLAAGLSDDLFENDGQLTKREIRSLTLSALAPRRGELLWDIGAGSGSIAIEWMLADPSMKAVAIEADAVRAERIQRNARALGTPGLRIVTGAAPEALVDLPTPNAIFIGGGGTDEGVVTAAQVALRQNGRLVANGVTLEMEALLMQLHATHGGTLTRVAVSRVEPLGLMKGWRPALPITQWSWVKA